MATTFAVDLRAALVVILEAQRTATPTLLRKVWKSVPGTFNELPLAFIDIGAETVQQDAGTRTRTMVGATVTIIDAYANSEQEGDRLDQLRDDLVDRLTAASTSLGRGSILDFDTIIPGEVTRTNRDGVAIAYRSLTFNLSTTFRKEGRD